MTSLVESTFQADREEVPHHSDSFPDQAFHFFLPNLDSDIRVLRQILNI